MRAYGLGLIPYFPLANGLLTGKVRREAGAPPGSRLHGREDYITPAKLDRVEALEKWGQADGRSLLQIAIGALAVRPSVGSVIAGATSAEQVRQNAAAVEWQPTAEEQAEIDALAPAHRPG